MADKKKRKKSNMVVRRVNQCKVCDIYSFKNGETKLLGRREITTKINETEIAKEFGVDKVIIDVVETKQARYGLDIDTFMSLAVLLTDEDEVEEVANNEKVAGEKVVEEVTNSNKNVEQKTTSSETVENKNHKKNK